MNKDQVPQSSDGQAPNAPHNYEEEETPRDNDYQPQGQLPYCHDLKEILWVPNFLLYLSNMLSTIGVKELRFYT